MENATRALLMAASILIGILIITLMVILFRSGASAGKAGEKEASRLEVEQFNVHFSKYLNKKLTVYDVVSICNYAQNCGRSIEINGAIKSKDDIKENINNKYKLNINDYDKDGFVKEIEITTI